MKNGIKSLLIVGLLLIASVFVATAYSPQFETRNNVEMGTFHEQMEEIVEEGTYSDLETFRAENDGFGGPRWVVDEESFNEWKERYELMETNGLEPGFMRGSRGQGRSGGCPMRG